MAQPEQGLNITREAKTENKLVGAEATRFQIVNIERRLEAGTITIKAGCRRAFDYPSEHERQVPLTQRQIRKLNEALSWLR